MEPPREVRRLSWQFSDFPEFPGRIIPAPPRDGELLGLLLGAQGPPSPPFWGPAGASDTLQPA